ncbi:F-box protein At1g30790-like [Bidens hawaiensis]|uniref:F-box protein At1g30790-like n=1 Tax=Bidens hawaiensis TaxID=980011 RepID=UPI00404A1C3C
MDVEDNTRPVSIPHDLISEILQRLPVKSLTRFRSVSTRWNSTIIHPSFSKSHFSHSATAGASTTLVLTFINRFNSERTIFSVTIPSNETKSVPNPTHVLTIPGFAHPFVSQSVNGLICFNLGSMCVCNPSTRKFVKLPWTQPEMNASSPACTHHRTNVFGYDPVSNAHKVLDSWITCHENDEIIVEHRIFTIGSRSNKWRRITGGPLFFPFNESVCINGQVYFRAFPSMLALDKPVMVAFDLDREEFQLIEMPDNAILESEESVLMEHDGRLTIVDHQGNVFLMWILMNKTWVKKRVEIPVMYSEIKDRRRCKLAGTTFSGELIFAEKSLVSPFFVYLYDVKKNEVKKVGICGLTDFEFKFGHVFMNVTSVNEHVESIMSLS